VSQSGQSAPQQAVIGDPRGLLAAAEPVADFAALSELFGVSTTVLKILAHVFYTELRFVKARPRRLYAVADMRAVVERERAKIEARRLAHQERMRAEAEAARIKRDAKKTPSCRACTPKASALGSALPTRSVFAARTA
jgi:hypothetical protein